MRFFIKNAEGFGDPARIKRELDRLGIRSATVGVGEINIQEELSPLQYAQLCLALESAGIEMTEDKREILVRRIRDIIKEVVDRTEEPLIYNLSCYLSDRLHHDYTYMSAVFSETLHITIEKFYICHKIGRVKEYLLKEGMTMTEIAHKMHYSSLAHLSSQFKRVTGLTASQFKKRYGKGNLPQENCE